MVGHVPAVPYLRTRTGNSTIVRSLLPTRQQAAEEFLLSRIDRALADVRRTHSQDVTVSLDEFEDDLVEIQALLDASDERGEDLRDALRARVDFADGGVARE